MALFVINEWFWHDSAGDNGNAAQKDALDFIGRLAASQHQIVVIEGSRFDQKAWALCKSQNTIVKVLVKLFLNDIRVNSERCLLLKPDAASALSDELLSAVKPDDHHLVCAQLSAPGSVLITTDTTLREALGLKGLPTLSRDEFFAQYFGA